ncbi:MAG: hypothetical protein LBV72_00485 [Tannerella sp.]|jgi:predicted esterase YcpF (UPF0227 family)|nr:hypothetical protein [Tannerella sp.]
MKIGLIDIDGHNFSNIALMKISTYHKKQGHRVEWVNYFEEYDKVYMSKIFTFSPEPEFHIRSKEIIKGGTGYDVRSWLPDCIENSSPDYSIYPECDYSVVFFSRGCIRNCPFCIVIKKEGYIKPVRIISLNTTGKHIEVLDNNFFANPLWRDAVEFLNETNQYVNLHGVDVRIMNREQAIALNSMKLKGSSIHIAWDNPKDNIVPQLNEMLKYVKRYKITCYVLIGYWSTPEQDYERVMKLKELGINPFVQPYRDFENKRIPTDYERKFARWVNKKELFNSCTWKEYDSSIRKINQEDKRQLQLFK